MVRKTKTTKSTKASAKAVTATPPTPPTATVAEVIEAPVETVVSSDPTLSDDFNEFMAHLSAVRASLSSLSTEFRTLQRRAEREMKAALKAGQKRRRKTGNRSPSGFVKPTLISNELATFLNKPLGTEMARTEVTREINAYIRANSLQDKQNGRKINPDTKLRTLLKIKKNDELTYFNLQRYMSPHFAKQGVILAETHTASSAK